MRAMDRIGKHMTPGKIYRRAELAGHSRSPDRDLKQLVSSGKVWKLWRGAYCVPETCVFGEVPPEPHDVVKAYLNSDDFLMTSLNIYNSLGVGTTQLYGEWLVYNRTRSGRKKVRAENYYFLNDRDFPEELTIEFLYVDLINNIDMLGEDYDAVRRRAAKRTIEIGIEKVARTARRYGKPSTIIFFDHLRETGLPYHGRETISA